MILSRESEKIVSKLCQECFGYFADPGVDWNDLPQKALVSYLDFRRISQTRGLGKKRLNEISEWLIEDGFIFRGGT